MAKELKYVPMMINIKNVSVLRRFFALLIDIIIISYSFLTPILLYLSEEIKMNTLVTGFDVKLLMIITLIAFSYFLIFDYLVGNTIGEMILGIEKIKFDDSMTSSIIYALFQSSIFVFPYALFMDYIMTYFTNMSFIELFSKEKFVLFEIKYNQYVL